MKKHYETHVEDTDKLISVAGPILEYKSWYEQYRKLMEEQAQRKYGLYTPTSEGDDDDFPSISGMIARYSALGLTNEQMKENPVWVDKTGNGHDLQMKNFLWGGMSGVGGYGDENYQTFYKFTLDDYVFIASPPGVKHMNFTFRVTGLQPRNKLTLAFFGTTNTVYGTWDKDGIYTVDADIVEAGKPTYFYNGYGATRGEFTIEILPLYPGFILGDGVDDFAVTEEDFNFEKEFCVYLAAIFFPQDSPHNDAVLGKDSNKDIRVLQYNNNLTFNSGNHTYCPVNLGQFSIVAFKRKDDTLIAKNLTTGVSNSVKATSGVLENPDKFYLWVIKGFSGYSDAAIAGSIIVNGHFTTDEDDEKVLDWYKKQYPWLFPDQAWTVTGKTNEDEDRATIANITGNGNNLVLSNFGFAEGSGYGLYKLNFNNWFANSGSGNVNIVNVVNPHKIVLEQSQEAVGAFFLGKNVSYSGELKISVSNKPSDIELSFGSTALGKVILNEGINIVKINPVNTSIGFFTNKAFEAQNIIIEQIPEYEGYLITDGVDDSGRAVGLTISKDFTLVGEWILFSKTSVNAGLSIHPQIHIFNRPEAIQITFRTAGKTLPVKSLKVICSDGRCYDENWSELKINVGEFTDNKGTLFVASNGTNYAQIAFKNLGIYDNQILSKDDCIKAYNYLQTLKAK